jgi:flagellar biosynthesis protein FlhG
MGRVRVVSVLSGKGGVGKSHLAVNLAALAAAAGRRVLLVDADGGLSNLDVLLGVEPTGHLGEVLEGRDAKDVISEVRPGLWLLAGQPADRRLTHLDEASRHALASAWSRLVPEFDWVVVDVSSGMSDDTLFFASAGQEPLLVVTDEPTSISDATAVLRSLGSRAIQSVQVVVNNVRTAKCAQAVFGKLLQAVSDCPVRLKLATHVPDDQNLRRAAILRRPLVELAPTSPASRAFERLCEVLHASTPRPTGGPWLTEAQLSVAGDV